MRRYLCGLLFLLTGCGLHAPDISEQPFDGPGLPATSEDPPYSATTQIEFEIRRKIYCELKDAVQYVNSIPYYALDHAGHKIKGVMIPDSWIAQISLSLQVDESTALAPGVTYNDVIRNAVRTFGVGNTLSVGQSFNLGFGATLSATATRVDKFNPTYSVEWLMKQPTKDITCDDRKDIFPGHPNSSPFLIQSDLGITKWLTGAIIAENWLPSHPPIKGADAGNKVKALAAGDIGSPGGGAGGGGSGGADKGGGGSLGPYSVSTELKFVIVSSGNVTPTWKLLSVSANTSGTLYSAGRTRTHDLIITVGPPNGDTTAANFSLQVQSAVASGVRAALAPQ